MKYYVAARPSFPEGMPFFGGKQIPLTKEIELPGLRHSASLRVRRLDYKGTYQKGGTQVSANLNFTVGLDHVWRRNEHGGLSPLSDSEKSEMTVNAGLLGLRRRVVLRERPDVIRWDLEHDGVIDPIPPVRYGPLLGPIGDSSWGDLM
jgi:hypothetical protein